MLFARGGDIAHAHGEVYFSKKGCSGKLAEAIGLALAESGLKASDIDAVMVAENGIKELKDAEDAALSSLGIACDRINVRDRVGEARAAATALEVAHAAMLLSGDIKGKAYEHVLAIGASWGGSYDAVVLGKA